VYRFVEEYVSRKVDFQSCDPCELGLEKYVTRMVERLRDAIVPDDAEGEPPLLPILNRYKPIGTTVEVDFKTTRPCYMTQRSHVNQVVADTMTWEGSAAFRLEQSRVVACYARNDHLGLVIPYEFMGVDHGYEPDFLVRLANGFTLILEVKGFEDEQTRAKHAAAKRWVTAVNNWGQLGKWMFHVSRNPLLLDKELAFLTRSAG
jgi:type III restriction enzyme